MHLVYHNEAQVAKQARNRSMPMQEQCLQGLRRNLQDTGGMLHELCLLGGGNVTMPAPDRDAAFRAKLCKARKLVIDQGLERSYVKCPDRAGRIL